jgi:hypothetical protein
MRSTQIVAQYSAALHLLLLLLSLWFQEIIRFDAVLQ